MFIIKPLSHHIVTPLMGLNAIIKARRSKGDFDKLFQSVLLRVLERRGYSRL